MFLIYYCQAIQFFCGAAWQVLRSKFWSMQVPRLPGKKYFFNFDEDFINKRRQDLEKYVRDLLQVACFSQSDELWQFFTDQASIVGVPPELREDNERHASVMRERESYGAEP